VWEWKWYPVYGLYFNAAGFYFTAGAAAIRKNLSGALGNE
jgi:hypothetical protein